MLTTTAIVPYTCQLPAEWVQHVLNDWTRAGIAKIVLIGPAGAARLPGDHAKVLHLATGEPFSHDVWTEALLQVGTPTALCVHGDRQVRIGDEGIQRFVRTLEETGSAIAYADYHEASDIGIHAVPTLDYQLGSIREGFDFGPVMGIGLDAVREAQHCFGPLAQAHQGALYDLRLRLSIIALPMRIPEPLSICRRVETGQTERRLFDYVDPRNADVQKELEQLATDHLRRLKALLEPRPPGVVGTEETFPVEASVIIPVRNREGTIAEAVQSALTQQTSFDFNVIVVDNHSTDGTAARLDEQARQNDQLVVLRPGPEAAELGGLNIGGCWNLAIRSPQCGRLAVQLDSDDVYASPHALQRMVDKLNEGPYAMVVGSYRTTDYTMNDVPPGVVDHREWTPENGHNNLLRVNGIGAPRGYDTSILRCTLFPDVPYGEDYAVALRMSRDHAIGRILEPIYVCRRWEGNSDANLPQATRNQHDLYKDRLRTLEILTRQRMNLQSESDTR